MDEVMHSHGCAAPLDIVWKWSCRMPKRRLGSSTGWETSEMRRFFATTVTLLHNDAATCDLPLAGWSPPNSCISSPEAELLMRFQRALSAFVCPHTAQPAFPHHNVWIHIKHKRSLSSSVFYLFIYIYFLLTPKRWRIFWRFCVTARRDALLAIYRWPICVKLDIQGIKNKPFLHTDSATIKDLFEFRCTCFTV